jgi:hypothetical protein
MKGDPTGIVQIPDSVPEFVAIREMEYLRTSRGGRVAMCHRARAP